MCSGTILSSHSLGTNSSGTDVSVISGGNYDWLYVNAVSYQSVHVYKIMGAGIFELVQRYDVKDMSPDVTPTNGFAVSNSSQFLRIMIDKSGTSYFPQMIPINGNPSLAVIMRWFQYPVRSLHTTFTLIPIVSHASSLTRIISISERTCMRLHFDLDPSSHPSRPRVWPEIRGAFQPFPSLQ